MLNYLSLHRGEPTGWLRLQLEKSTLWIDKLYVLPEYMGRGFGKQLLAFTEQLAATHTMDRLCLYTREHSPAWHFYDNTGFRTEDVSHFKHSGFKEGFIPRARMIKYLL
jgi:GNAT superfamily N-acetyltransferase